MGGSENRWGAAKTGGGWAQQVAGSENGWGHAKTDGGAVKTGGGQLKWVVSGTYSF